MASPAEQLAAIQAGLERNIEQARAVAGMLAPGQLLRSPGGGWPVAACLEHLNLSLQAYQEPLEKGLLELQEKGLRAGARPYRMEWMARLLRYVLEPPSRVRLKTPPAFQPAIADPLAVLPRFLDLHDWLLDYLARSEGWALDKVKIASPFAPNVRYNLYSALVLCDAHDRRHLAQAEKIKLALDV